MHLRSFRLFIVAFALLFTACARPNGSPPQGGASAAVDVVSAAGVSLGSNWYPLETYRGETFRWVKNDAELIVDRAALRGRFVYIELEPGPSIKTSPMKLSVTSGSSSSMLVDAASRETIAVRVTGNIIALHVLNGGKTPPNDDPRILNFRVFRVGSTAPVASSSGGAGDIAAADVQLGSNWGALEHYNGQTFRWIDNDATLSVPSRVSGRLDLTLEPGPGIRSFPFTLDVYATSGRLVEALTIGPKGGKFSIPLAAGIEQFRLHIQGGGKKIQTDPRILNVRVFDVRVTAA